MKEIDVLSESELARIKRLRPERRMTARDYFCLVYIALIALLGVLGIVLMLLPSCTSVQILCCGATLLAVSYAGRLVLDSWNE